MKNNLIRHFKSYSYALRGLKSAFSSWSNLWVEFLIGFVVVAAGFYFGLSSLEWLFIILAIVLVIVTEMINTVVEVVLDFLKKEHHEDIRLAKDLAAAAVLVAAFGAAVMGLIIFLPKIWQPK